MIPERKFCIHRPWKSSGHKKSSNNISGFTLKCNHSHFFEAETSSKHLQGSCLSRNPRSPKWQHEWISACYMKPHQQRFGHLSYTFKYNLSVQPVTIKNCSVYCKSATIFEQQKVIKHIKVWGLCTQKKVQFHNQWRFLLSALSGYPLESPMASFYLKIHMATHWTGDPNWIHDSQTI